MDLLSALMIQEEFIILGGNASTGLGTPTAPTVANSASGGTIAAATYDVIVIALTLEGYPQLVGGGRRAGRPGRPAPTRTAAPTTSAPGVGQKSAPPDDHHRGSTSSITATTPAVKGAVAYAWYVGTAGNERISQITTINSVLITAIPGASQLASAQPGSDQSRTRSSSTASSRRRSAPAR
jgi:hypothetical protein